MKKYIVLYTAPISAMEQMKNTDPEEAKKGMEKWHAWAEQCGESLIDLGAPLGTSQTLTPEGPKDANTDIAGYSIVTAENIEAAGKLFEGHPHLAWNAECSIRIHEIMPLPDM